MHRRHVAYGLELRPSFALPGMRQLEAHGLPAIEIDLAASEQLEQAFSGGGERPWRGRASEGRELEIRRGGAGDALFRYGDEADFHLDAAHARVLCAPRRGGPAWQRALLCTVLSQVSLTLGYEGLHAAALDAPGGVVAIAGPRGAGKSTIAAELMRRGWPLFADDVLTLGWREGAVQAHPGTPHISLDARRSSAAQAQAIGTTLAELSGERWLTAHRAATRPRHVRMLCLLDGERGIRPQLLPLPANLLALAPHMLGFRGDARRQRERFELYGELMQSAALVRASGDVAERPAALADLIEHAIERPIEHALERPESRAGPIVLPRGAPSRDPLHHTRRVATPAGRAA